MTKLVRSAATGGVIIKTELNSFRFFIVSSLKEPFPIWNLTPDLDKGAIEDSIFIMTEIIVIFYKGLV